MDFDRFGQAEGASGSVSVVVPYARFLERRAWREKIVADVRWITDQCLKLHAMRPRHRAETRGERADGSDRSRVGDKD
jgi:hypothetical protein